MSLSRPIPDPGKGLRFLSFDGGGIRAVSQALMVREMMNRVQTDHQLSTPPRVCDYFDMVCGSGFGGILAIMCGILKMTGDEVVHEFVNLCKAVFADGLDTTKRTAILEREMKGVIGKYSTGGEERRMFCEDDTCKTFVCAVAFHNAGHPQLFRNYRTRENPSVDCMLWEAACATTSMPDLFKPISIDDVNIGETFVGGDLRWNNPTDELTREAAEAFKGRRICTIINIGSGHSGHLSLSKGLTDLFPRIALDCERVADDMERRFGNTPEVFWRLSVEQGLQGQAVDLSNLDALVSHTHSYLQSARTTRNINTLLQELVRCPERIPVDGISGLAPAVLEVLRRKLCPPPTQYFTGRHADLKKLDEHFSSTRKPTSCCVGVLYGIGGGGKSQIGLEFVRRSHGRFVSIYISHNYP
ncbi:acyl transferase/acyl hydrolase/lysophospholipase [Flagelloscypha sp. PMI_526]|nr:acyl transferase/acyl hydrolase/lysophospholipase [Flagelloscypha sp. PMI_526]